MKTFSIGALIAAAAALGISILCTFTLDNALSWTDRVNLIFDPASAESFDLSLIHISEPTRRS